jgi:hypothetical protein
VRKIAAEILALGRGSAPPLKLQTNFIYVSDMRRKGAETSRTSRKAVDFVFPEMASLDWRYDQKWCTGGNEVRG